MSVGVTLAERFVLANARLLERHRTARLLHGGPVDPILAALRAYRNDDGGFGHALEPDVRGPESEPAATLHALDVLAEIGALGDPMVAAAAAWVEEIADPDGGVPFVLPDSALYPHAPWMVAVDGGSQITFALAAVLYEAGARTPWLERAGAWCWAELAHPGELHPYAVKFSLAFLDAVPDASRATAVIETLRPRVGADGSIAVTGAPTTSGSLRSRCRRRPARAAARSSPRSRSTTISTGSSARSRTTAAGRSTGSDGRRGNPSSGAAS